MRERHPSSPPGDDVHEVEGSGNPETGPVIVGEAGAGHVTARLDDLRRAVSSGTYVVDAPRIARRLLERGLGI